jgi:hypothetical protein
VWGLVMGEWKGPVKDTFVTILLAILVFITFFTVIIYTGFAWEALICGGFWYVLVIIVASFFYYYRLNEVTDHVYSRWDLDFDHVCWRIDTEIQRRGVRVNIDRWGHWVVFPLPPLSIFVKPGNERATVFVGPLTADNQEKVDALKAFVDAALGKRA